MAGRKSEVSEDAREDVLGQYGWYLKEAGIKIAERYLAAFRGTVEFLVVQPEAGILRKFRNPRLSGIRSFQMSAPFRVHLVFYRVEGEVLVVFRVLNGMRDLPRRLIEPPE